MKPAQEERALTPVAPLGADLERSPVATPGGAVPERLARLKLGLSPDEEVARVVGSHALRVAKPAARVTSLIGQALVARFDRKRLPLVQRLYPADLAPPRQVLGGSARKLARCTAPVCASAERAELS